MNMAEAARFGDIELARLRGESLGRTLDVDEAVLPLTHQFLGPATRTR